MIRVETTPGCPRTVRVLMALEELGLGHLIEMRPEGFFAKTYNLEGPRFEEGDVVIFQPNAILRYLMRAHAPSSYAPQDTREWAIVDEWMDFCLSGLVPSAARLARHRHNVPEVNQDRALIEAESHLLVRA